MIVSNDWGASGQWFYGITERNSIPLLLPKQYNQGDTRR